MSKKILVDTVSSLTGNTDLTLEGAGSGVPNLEAGFKVAGTAGVPTASIQDDAVTLAKMAVGTDGNLISYDASGNPVAVATGSATQVLTSAGAGQPPAFADAGGGGLTHIHTIIANNTATIDFNAKFTTAFDGYLLFGNGIAPVTADVQPWMRFSTDGGSNYLSGSSDYAWTAVGQRSGGGSVQPVYDFSDAKISLNDKVNATGLNGGTAVGSNFIAQISTPMGSGISTGVQSLFMNGGGNYETGQFHTAGSPRSSAQHNSVRFLMESGNVSKGTFSLFGINKS